MNFCIRLLIIIYGLYFCVSFSGANLPGFEGFSSSTEGESKAIESSNSIDDSSYLILWGRSLDLQDSMGPNARRLFNDWTKRVKVSMGITPREAANISTRKEMFALRKFLSKFVSYKKPDKDSPEAKQLERKYKYYRHLEGLAQKLNQNGLSSQYLTVHQLMELHSQGRFIKNNSPETLNSRDVLLALEQAIEDLGGSSEAPLLTRVKKKFYTIVEIAIRAHAKKSNDGNASYLLKKWEKLRRSNKPTSILRFPWSEIASGQPGLSRYRSVFKYAMTLPSYLQLTYRQFFSVETMMWFGEHQQMLSALDQFDTLRGEINFDDLEASQTGDKGRLSLSELVRYSRTQPQFRELTGVLYNRYLDSLKRQDFIKREMLTMRAKVLNARKIPRIENLIAKLSQQEVQKVIDDFEQNVNFQNLIEPLLLIDNTEGVVVSDTYKQQFLDSTGLSYDQVIQTQGDKTKLLQLIRKTFPHRSSTPEFIEGILNKVSTELQRKVNSESTQDLLDNAKYQTMIRRIMQQKDASKLFLITSNRLVFKSDLVNDLQTLDSSSIVDSANKNFDEALGEAETQLAELDEVSSKSRQTFQSIKFLEKELTSLNQNISMIEMKDNFQEIESWYTLLRQEKTRVRKLSKELKSEQNKYDLVRSRLAQLIGLNSQDFKSNPDNFNKALDSYLKDFSSKNDNSKNVPKKLVNLLLELRSRSTVIREHRNSISQSNERLRGVTQKISNMSKSIKRELPNLIKNRKILEEQHSLIYKKISYLSEVEKSQIIEKASMSAEFDEGVANQYASRYLIGFIRKGDTKTTTVEEIRFHSFTDSTISFDLTLNNIELNDNWENIENRQTIRLKVRPRVVKSHPDNFDFQIQSLKLQKDGEEPVELRTGFAVILDSTLSLLNLMISSLNDTPYENLKFKYFPHLETIRVMNGLPIFESFPSFKIDLVKLMHGKLFVYGDVSGENLGNLLGRNLVKADDSTTETNPKPEGMKSEYERGLIKSSNLVGEAKIRIHQKLINDFYIGMRSGVISEKSSDSDTTRFFEGLENAKIYFKDSGQVNMLFEGDLRNISTSTNRFYSLINGIATPYLGVKQGLARAGSGLLKFVTFGKVKVEVDPKNYQSPSGKFSIFLAGQSSFREGKTYLDFDTVSLYDPINKGALQPYLGTAKVIMSVTRSAGWLYSQLIKMINAIPGVTLKQPQKRLDHLLLTWLVANLAHQIDSQIEDLEIEVTSFNSYNFIINDFEIVEGIETQIVEMQIESEMIEIVSTAEIQN